MAGLFEDIKAKAPKLPDNVQVNTGLFRDLMPNEKNQTFKLTTEGNPGESIDFSNVENPGLFDDLKPETQTEDIDGDKDLWQKVKFAAGIGFTDTYRGVKQLAGFDLEKMREDQKKLYEYMQDPDGSTNYMVAAAYFGSALLDPAGWLIPVTKAKTLYQAAKYGFVSSGIVGGLGYVDEESILDTRAKQAAASAIGGTIISPVIAGIGKKIKGEKVFSRESLGIPGFEPTVKAQADAQLHKLKLSNEAGKKDREAFNRRKIEDVEIEDLKDMPQDKTKLLRGPRLFFQENIVKPYQNKFGKPALNYITNGEYGAEAGGALTGGVTSYAFTDEEAPTTTKLGVAFTGALTGALGLGGIKRIKVTRTFGKEEEAIEVTESVGDILGRNFIDGYKMPSNFKQLKAEAQGFSNHIGMRFSFLANKIKLQLSPDEQKILFNMLEGDIKHSVKTKSLTGLKKESRDLITEIAQEYVDMGLISPITFKRNKDIYLKRSYRGKLEDRPFGEELRNRGATLIITKDEYNKLYKKQKAYTTTTQDLDKKTGLFRQAEGKRKLIKGHRGWELLGTSQKEFRKLKANDEVQIRWEFTKPQRVGLGEIEDAAFAIAETGRGFAQTISQYRFYQNISKQDYVFDGLRQIPVAQRQNYKKMPVTVISKTDGKQRYGALAGKYVPDEVYKNLVAANRYAKAEGNTFYSGYRKLNSVWKVSKTAWNPTVHVNNVMSNFVLHDLIDAEFKYLKPAWTALTTHGKTVTKNGKTSIQKSKLVEAATKYGVFDADFVTQELKNIKVGSKFPYAFNDRLDPFNNSVNAAKGIYDDVLNKNVLTSLTNFYRFEDAVFRLSVFQDRIAKGFSYSDAALDARRAFIDYNIDAPAINWMRNTITPFLAYTYRIIPILAETAIVRPWKYAKYAALGYGLNQMGDLVGGGDEEAERALMPERKQGSFFGMPFLPYRSIKIPVAPDDEGNPYYMDFTRFVPGGDIFDLGNPGIPGLPAPFQPSFGLGGEILFPMLGYDLFRGEKIKGQTGMFKEDMPIRLNAIKDKLIPNIPFLPGSYSSQKLEKTRKGKDSPFVPEQSELTALMQTLGFKIEKAELDKLKTGKVYELKRKLKGYEEQINKHRNDFRKGLINRETAKNKIDKVAKEMRILAEKYGVEFEKATYSQPKKPFEDVKGLFERQN